ncbi:MAG: hypothetical protein KatS3mg061_0336 [Dehalococcoidia bacterium]|nr:MAG: hypothetical protein KatS3mg061_0336 [Dehalococcoidia bacterium]
MTMAVTSPMATNWVAGAASDSRSHPNAAFIAPAPPRHQSFAGGL